MHARSPTSDHSELSRERPTSGRAALEVKTFAVSGPGAVPSSDWLAAEEPLEIRAAGPGQSPVSVAVTMRTPGDDAELAVGFLHTEGLLVSPDNLSSAFPHVTRTACNIIQVDLVAPFDASALQRHFFAHSSCGLCGKATLDQIAVRCDPVAPGLRVAQSTLLGLPPALRAAQAVFDRTGGLHAAGLFAPEGRLLTLREDVGRHNAVDKVIGRAVLDRAVPLADRILLVSGRAGFEILQKAAVAGIPIVCAVSAPSSLAVSLADRLGLTLVGFLRGSSFNIYSHPGRIDLGR